jgi:DNA-binding NarL/FixJ family response regulator
LVDVQLPGIDGFEVARRLAAERGAPSVVLISSRPRSSYGDRLDDASVRGFIAKHEFSVAALRGVLLAGSDAGDRRG